VGVGVGVGVGPGWGTGLPESYLALAGRPSAGADPVEGSTQGQV
jgi:hypothetical protein